MTEQTTTHVETDPTAPLAGVRVLEFGGFLAGPYAGTYLASLGAEVIKVEPEGSGEPFRRGKGNTDKFFRQVNAGKKSVAIDLKSAEGRAKALELVKTADVLIENMRPDKMAQLGLSSEVCREVNPGLIYSSVSGFGATGSLARQPAYDSMGQAMSGLFTILNDPGEPRLSGTPLVDQICGIMVAMGVLVQLVGRSQRGGRGVTIETSMLEAVTALTTDAITSFDESGVSPTRNSRNAQAVNFCLPGSDGQFITVHLSAIPKFWNAFAKVLGREDLLDDERFRDYYARSSHYAELTEIAREELRKRPRDEWLALFMAADVPSAPVLDVPGAINHPQARSLGAFTALENGDTLVEVPWRFDSKRRARSHRAPEVGEHTDELLSAESQ